MSTELMSNSFAHYPYISLFFNAGALSTAFAEEVQPGATYAAVLIQLDRIDIGRKHRESPFHTNTIGDLTHCECGGMSGTLAFDHIATETLDTLFATFNDLIVNG